MSSKPFQWKNVSFTEYLNKDGAIIKTVGLNMAGEVLILNINPVEYGSEEIATVSCTHGELYFVPAGALTFLAEKE